MARAAGPADANAGRRSTATDPAAAGIVVTAATPEAGAVSVLVLVGKPAYLFDDAADRLAGMLPLAAVAAPAVGLIVGLLRGSAAAFSFIFVGALLLAGGFFLQRLSDRLGPPKPS